ncbi:20S proteasome subunit alpha 2 [Nematocida sp. LUAm3]|nr:20S proteasome subunit alpha 2 [Nematocida sp. LUAm3]
MSQTIDVSGRYTDTGNLLQLEYAKKAAAKGNTAIGISFKDGVLLAVQKYSPSKIVDIDSVSAIEAISRNYAIAYSGLAHDKNVVNYLMRDFVKQYTLQTEKETSEENFLGMLRYYLIYFCSYMNIRPIGCEFLISTLSEGRSRLYHADPSGAINRCKAYAIGCNAQAAKTELEKITEASSSYSLEEAVQCAMHVFDVSNDGMVEGPFSVEMMEITQNGTQRKVSSSMIEKYAE